MSGFSGPVTATQFQGVPIDSTAPTSQQVLIYDSVLGKYVPTSASSVNVSKVNLANQSSAPATPSSSSNLFAFTTNGRGMFQQQNESGSPAYIGSAPWNIVHQLITPGPNAAPSAIYGYLAAVASSGTFSSPTVNSAGCVQNIATAATSGAQAYVAGTKAFYRTQATTTYYGGFSYYSRFYLPDASYPSNTYLFAGMSSSIVDSLNAGVGQGAGESLAAFQWSTTGNWQFTTAGSTTTTVATSTPVTAQHVYECFIWCANAGTTVYWQINDLTAGTSNTGTVTNSLPTSGVAMAAGVGLETNTNTARNIQLERVFVRSDLG